MKSSSVTSNDEKREYFRIDDSAIVQYRTVSDEEYLEFAQAGAEIPHKLTLKAKFDCMSRQLQPLHRTINASHPDIARYLSILDQKMNMLTEQLIKDELDAVDSRPQVVNIGAGGMSFAAESPVMTGALLELKLVLLPEMMGVFTYANVVSCARNPSADSADGEYDVAVQFEHMTDEVRDIISRHVLTKEQARLSKLRQE